MPRTSKIPSKSSSDRCFLSLKRSLRKNSLDGREDSVSLCPCPSSIQNPCTRCSTMLAQACSNSSWLRALSSSCPSSPSWCSWSWCSWSCPSSSSWCSSSSSSKMLSAEKHYKNIKEYNITLTVSWREAEGNIKGPKETIITISDGARHQVFHYTSQLQKLQKEICLMPAGTTDLSEFQGKWPDHLQLKSSSCCFPRDLVSLVHPRELVSFDP